MSSLSGVWGGAPAEFAEIEFSAFSGASKPTGNDAFCVIGNVGGKLKDDATTCVLTFETRVDASECVCGQGSSPSPLGGAFSAPPDLLAGFGDENREGGLMERERK